MILVKTYTEPVFCINEALRYARCKDNDADIHMLCEACFYEVRNKLNYKVCYRELSVTINGNTCDFGAFKLHSNDLAKNLKDCEKVIVFAATVGTEIDRMIAKYNRLSPSKALFLQAIGSERVEALCDTFCKDLSDSLNMQLKPRFSPGYGDLSIDVQKNFFSVLDCSKKIGITLNDNLMMSPSKSVTAFVGIKCD